MFKSHRNIIYLCALLFSLLTVNACKPHPHKLTITLLNGQPCFSYSQRKAYSFSSLYITKVDPDGGDGWAIQIDNVNRKDLREPNSPNACIKYGVPIPGTEVVAPVKPLQFDTPYKARLYTNSISGVSDELRYASDFCLTRDARGETILVKTFWDDEKGVMKCLKPGEKAKRSFWQRLFGK